MRQQQLAGIAAELTQPQGIAAPRAARRCSTAPTIPTAGRSPAPAIRRWCGR